MGKDILSNSVLECLSKRLFASIFRNHRLQDADLSSEHLQLVTWRVPGPYTEWWDLIRKQLSLFCPPHGPIAPCGFLPLEGDWEI